MTRADARPRATPGAGRCRGPAGRLPAVVSAILFLAGGALAGEEVATWIAPAPEVSADRAAADRYPLRVARRVPVGLAPGEAGTRETLPDGGSRARLRVRSPGARWLALHFDHFDPKPGVALRVRGSATGAVLGPFERADRGVDGGLWLPPIAGDEVVVEVLEPPGLGAEGPAIRLAAIAHGDRDWPAAGGPPEPRDLEGQDDAGWCNLDVACPAGDGAADAARGVVMLLIAGTTACSGALLNTTASDCRTYVLTANHCLDSAAEAAGTIAYFGYVRPECDAGTAPSDRTVTGATIVAMHAATDFTLLELASPPPPEFLARFLGWSRDPAPAGPVATLHHPSADPKKISRDYDPPAPSPISAEHWRVAWDLGVTEPGSSGAPLLDPGDRVLGPLSRGISSCADADGWDEFGRLDEAWTGGGTPTSRLSDRLDPAGLDPLALDGRDHAACLAPSPRLVAAGLATLDAGDGDGDGAAEPGEALALEVALRNDGTAAATAVAGTLSTSTPGATIECAGAAWPDLAIGATAATLPPHFGVRLAPDHPCGVSVDLSLALDAAEGGATLALTLETGEHRATAVLADDFESGFAGWTVETPLGASPWVPTTVRAASPVTSAYAADVATASDTRLVRDLGVLPPGARLRFRHHMDSEDGFDGGVLEIAVDGGAFSDAGDRIVKGGYTATIGSSYGSTLAGRPAWSGYSSTWRDVEVDLADLAGREVAVRFRFATDRAVGDDGWYLDDVALESVEVVCEDARACAADEDCDDGDPCTADACDPTLGCTHALPPPPAEVAGLRVALEDPATGTVRLSWDPAPDADVYHLYRAAERDLSDLVRVVEGISDTSTLDAAAVAAGGVLHYLVGAEGCGGASAP